MTNHSTNQLGKVSKNLVKKMALKKATVDMITLQSKSDADYITNLNNLVRRDFDVVYGIGFLMEEPIKYNC